QPSEDAYQPTPGGNGDAFVTRLAHDGASVDHMTYLGGSGSDVGRGIAVDSFGRAYVTGSTAADFPTTVDALQPEPAGGGDAFVTEVGAAGTALVYSSYLGGSGSEEGLAIARTDLDDVYVTGPGRAHFRWLRDNDLRWSCSAGSVQTLPDQGSRGDGR